MKPIIAIPSYRRPNASIFSKLENVGLETYVFVRAEEKEMYPSEVNRIVINNVANIGETRKKLVCWCNRRGIDWVFMFDDDIRKVENRVKVGSEWKCRRIIEQPRKSPSFEKHALVHWYKTAKTYNLALSSPSTRTEYRKNKFELTINSGQCIQCVLLHIPSIIEIGNYRSTLEVGAEDIHIQYKLMLEGYNTGVIHNIEYDCPSVGKGKGGNNAVENLNLLQRYRNYVATFQENVTADMNLMQIKETKTGLPSIKFKWRNWEGKRIENICY